LPARLKPCRDERRATFTVPFANELGFGRVKSRSVAALGMTCELIVAKYTLRRKASFAGTKKLPEDISLREPICLS
jgi:hypothetical protein